MSNFFKKYLLIGIFLGLAPSVFAMENRSIFNKMYGAITRILPILPSKFSLPSLSFSNPFSKYTFTKESTQRKKEQQIESIITAYYRKKSNAELTDKLQTVLENDKLEKNNVEKIKELLEYADSNIEIKGYTLLHIAALFENEELYEYLINQYNADPNILDKNGKTPFSIRYENATFINIIKTARESGKFKEDDIEKIKDLLTKKRANFEIGGFTLLHIAAQLQNEELFEYLIKHYNANPYARDKKYGWTPLDIKNANIALLNEVEIILKNNEPKKEDWEKIQTYLERGAYPNLIIEIKYTPELKKGWSQRYYHLQRPGESQKIPLLHIAIVYKQEDLVNCLLDHGANSNILSIPPNYFAFAKIFPEAPLFVLLLHSSSIRETGKLNEIEIRIFENLLKHQADINTENFYGNTILNHAIITDANILQSLIKNNVKINEKNSRALLEYTIECSMYPNQHEQNCKALKELCDSTVVSIADIDDNNTTIFHSIASNISQHRNPAQAITIAHTTAMVLTHLRPKNDAKITEIMKTILLIFNRKKLPRDLQSLILLNLFFSNDNYLHFGLYQELSKKYTMPHFYIFTEMERRITWLDKMLKQPNNERKTAYQILYDNCYSFDQDCMDKVGPLLDDKLLKDYTYIKQNPVLHYLLKNQPENEINQNLACEIYKTIQGQLSPKSSSIGGN